MALLSDTDDLPQTGCLLSLDNGKKRIGIAASDAAQRIAMPVGMVERSGKLAPAVAQIFTYYQARNAVGMIVGLPLNMDGSSGPAVQSAHALIRQLLLVQDTPVAFIDERLSSVAAQRALIECDVSRAARIKQIDAAAACLILQVALDRRQRA